MTKARSNAVAEAAKGDLSVGTGTNLAGILAVGSNGETLVADSSTSTGLRYTAGNAQGNPVLNSAFQIWQRGTTGVAGTATGAYFADRWVIARGVAGSTGSRQLTGDTTNLPSIQYCARIQRDSGNTSTSGIFLAQSFETINSIPFAGKTVTVSYYARAGANYSSASNALTLTAASGTGTDQQILGTYTGSSGFITSTATLTTTWQRFTATGTVSSSANEIAFYFNYTPSGTAGANDFFEITGVQIDVGNVALPFRTYAATIQGELAACQRYFVNYISGDGKPVSICTYYAGTWIIGMHQLPVTMRIAPSASVVSGTSYYASVGVGGSDLVDGIVYGSFSPNTVYYSINGLGASGTPGYSGVLFSNNASASISFSAEL